MSDDIRVDVKQLEMQELVLLSCIFFNKKYLQNSKYNVSSDMIYFSLILLGIPSNLVLFIEKKGGGFRVFT